MELKKGVSIIELVVVIGLISLLALAMSAIMLTTLVSSNRVRRTTVLKQSGDLALTQIQTLIRNAREVTDCQSAPPTLSTINPDGATTTIFLENERLASNSGIYLTPDNLTVTNFSLTCEGSDSSNPNLFKLGFDLTHNSDTGNPTENSVLHFETTTSLRND